LGKNIFSLLWALLQLKLSKKEKLMKRATLLCVLSLFLISFLAIPAKSQSAPDILGKMIDAMGGRKALENIKDTTISGSMELTQMGLSATITIYQKEPNKSRLDIEVMGMLITQACDGEVAWAVNPQTGMTEEMPEEQAVYMKRQSLGNAVFLDPKKMGITFSYKGKENIEGKDYLVLEQAFADGYTSTLYLDPETYLTFKGTGLTLNNMGVEVEAETFFSDYKEVDGMMIAHTLVSNQDGEEFMTMTITEVKFNSELEDSLFVMN
jgi:outer membrane lipoprotein-sorting protein